MSTDTPRRRSRRRLPATALVVLGLAFGGCGEHDEPPPFVRKAVPMAEVPEVVKGAARKTLQGVRFEDAWKNLDRDSKVLSYEIKGKNDKGKIREVRVSLTGEILEME